MALPTLAHHRAALGGLHCRACRCWVAGFIFPERLKSEAGRADRQSWFPDVAKLAVGGAQHCGEEERGRTAKAGRVLQPQCQIETRSHLAVAAVMPCTVTTSSEQPLRCCKVLVSVFTWAPAVSPGLNQLLAGLQTPLLGRFSEKPTFSIFPSGAPGEFDPGWFLAAALT